MRSGGFFRPRVASFTRGGIKRTARPETEASAERFRHLVLPHMDAAYRFARYLARDAATAEDLAQEAFLRAFRGFDRCRGENPKAWLLTIVRNCHLDLVASRRDPLRGAEPVEAIDGDSSQWADNQELEAEVAQRSDAAMLRQTIEDLPEPFRETLVLRELEELSYKEIAAITKVPIGTVMSRLARARVMLGELLLPPEGHVREARS